jgi:tight adherence protein B
MRSRAAAMAAALLFLLVSVALAAPASAADTVGIRSVDATAFPAVKANVLFTGERPNLADVSVRENGRIVADIDVVPLSEAQTPVGIVLVVDTSGSMRAAGKLDRAKAAAAQFVASKQPNDQLAIVSFDNEARVAVNFTGDAGPLDAAIAGLSAKGETALWDGVRVAAGLVAERTDLLPYIVVLSDGADTVSQTGFDAALGAVKATGAAAYTIAIGGGGESDAAALQRLARDTDGFSLQTTEPRDLAGLYQQVQRVLQNQYEVSWESAVTGVDELEVTVKVGAAIATARVPVQAAGVGAAVQPRVVPRDAAPGPLGTETGLLLVVVLVAAAAGLGGFLFVGYLRRDRAALSIVEAYSHQGGPAGGGAGGGGTGGTADADRSLVPEVMRRAVEATARAAGGMSVLDQLEVKLDQADVKLKAQEFVVFYGAGVVVPSLLALLAGGPLIALAVLVVVALLPIAVLNQLARARQKSFTDQLPDALQLLASSLRAGYSLVQGLEAVAAEIADPMGRELRRVVLESRLGRDLEVALDDTAKRMQSPDFDWVVIAIRIQREVGGNLAELLSSVADTMRSRERLRREVSALTAEGRLSAIIVGALPIVVGGALYVLNPGYLAPLFASTIGKAMILGGVLLTVTGFAWMRKVITIDV